MQPVSRHPLEEFKIICEMMRSYAMLRFYQMALLLGTSGGIVTGIASENVRRSMHLVLVLKLAGLLISTVFLIMDYRASSYWHNLRRRANELAVELGFEGFPVRSIWNPLTTTGASLLMHAFFVLVWLYGLLFAPPPTP
jgi:hypothetical protein